LHKLLTTGLA